MIEVQDLVKKYADCTAVNNVSFTVGDGEFVALTGRSGSGKSTLLKCVSGLLKPDFGEVKIDGRDIHKLRNSERAVFRNQTAGYVFSPTRWSRNTLRLKISKFRCLSAEFLNPNAEKEFSRRRNLSA